MAEKPRMTIEEFRRSRATASASKTGGRVSNSVSKHSTSDMNKTVNHSRPSSAVTKTNPRETDKPDTKSVEMRCEQAKLLRQKQIEERKKKHDERKAAVEDRKRQKEREESMKNETFRQLLDGKSTGSKGLGTGRRLPNLPGDGFGRRETPATRRLSSGSSSSDSPGSTPTGSISGNKSTRRRLTGPSSASTSSLSSVGNGQVENKVQNNLGGSKKTSSSANNLSDKGLAGSRSILKGKEKSVVSKASASGLPKAQSTGAIHQLGHGTTKQVGSRPPSGKKAKGKSSGVHHAGTSNEQEAKLALAEHRRRVREEAERQALLDKEKQEALRKQKEEEERRLAEENAKETARQEELARQLKQQEEERAKQLREQQEIAKRLYEEEEAAKREAEARHKEEQEMLRKQELEKRAKEAEKREREEEERLKREEEERQERRKRVEMIMSRTRLTATTNNNVTKAETYSSLEDLAIKMSEDSSYHSSTVSEILQKVKEKSSRASPSPEQDIEKEKENQNLSSITMNEQYGNASGRTTSASSTASDMSKLENFGSESDKKDYSNSTTVSLPLRQPNDNVDRRLTTADGDGEKNTNLYSDVSDGISRSEGTIQDGDLWKNVEHFMRCTESTARDKLEQNGAVAEDEDDEDCEEGQLWKVVEGKREISEIV